MATESATRFDFFITLKVDDDHIYRVRSPRADIGAYTIELTSLLMQAERALSQDAALPEAQRRGDQAVPKEVRDRLENLPVPEPLRQDQFRAYLGDAYDQMLADGMPIEVVKLAAATISWWIRTDKETAEGYWNSGGRNPDPTRPRNRASRRSSSRGT